MYIELRPYTSASSAVAVEAVEASSPHETMLV
eukprot:CAMPEP_0116942744 /NCGR_PEP_ID=MMETSP0467-20121206/34771_1 /TAXON_ID=283647 /ORGANISM="Mesodinium pulex, Strain SPMC105" /LENGTH=31 /DNA_ID= /DNA_START= /DNA_END= /DNA_ORIENTATION=